MVMGATCSIVSLSGVSSGHQDDRTVYVTSYIRPPSATIAMRSIQKALGLAVSGLSDEHYEQSMDHFRLWFKIGQKYSQNPSGLISDAIYEHRMKGQWNNGGSWLKGYSIGHLIPRFVDDVESDPIFAPYSTGLRSRFCTRIVQEFFDINTEAMDTGNNWAPVEFYVAVNLIAHCTNLGYLEEDLIRDYILQSLIYHPKLHDHQADALAILFKIAGATFGAYGHPAVVSRCFELLSSHSYLSVTRGGRSELIQVSTFYAQKRQN